MLNIYDLAREFESVDVNELNLDELDEYQIETLHSLLAKKKEFERFNKLALWKPYQFQKDWIEASKIYSQRYLSAANRIGKSYGACLEMAIHLTGLYPGWWNGAVIESSDWDYWAIGISQESVNNVLMKELLGISDARDLSNIGTGAIPKSCIDVFSMVKDGARCLKVKIRHTDGNTNTLHFFASTQDEGVFMGAGVKYILMDEQFKNESELYAQCLTRTATTKGFISVTATPELGQSPLWTLFSSDESGYLYFQSATWDDAPHLSEEDKARLLAGYPEYQREMRSKGIPVLGSGAVYPFSETEINSGYNLDAIKRWMENGSRFKNRDVRLMWGCDFGYASTADADPSTLILAAYDGEEDIIHVVWEWSSKIDGKSNRLAHMPEHMANIIKNSPFPNAPLIVPHDAKKQIDGLGTNVTRLSEMKRYGVNVIPTVFEIPYQLTTGAHEKPKHPRSLSWTIGYLCKLFQDKKLKIKTKECKGLMTEFRNYQYKDNGQPKDKNNHFLDAMRYAVVSIKHKGLPLLECVAGASKSNKWSTGNRINREMNRIF